MLTWSKELVAEIYSNIRATFKTQLRKHMVILVVIFINTCNLLLSTAERRGTPVLPSASVSDNSGNSPQMSAPRRLHEIDQSMQRFHVSCDNRCGYKSRHPSGNNTSIGAAHLYFDAKSC